jgi:hypothetical protein
MNNVFRAGTFRWDARQGPKEAMSHSLWPAGRKKGGWNLGHPEFLSKSAEEYSIHSRRLGWR